MSDGEEGGKVIPLNVNRIIENLMAQVHEARTEQEKCEKYIHVLESIYPYALVMIPDEPPYEDSMSEYLTRRGVPKIWGGIRQQHLRQTSDAQNFHYSRYLRLLQRSYGEALLELKKQGIYVAPTKTAKFKV